MHFQFDVRAWLEECQPHAADKKRFLEILGSALMSCGAEPTSNTKLVFDVSPPLLVCLCGKGFPGLMGISGFTVRYQFDVSTPS